MKSVLIAHSDQETTKILETAILVKGLTPNPLTYRDWGLDHILKSKSEVVLVEKDRPGFSGLDLLEATRSLNPPCKVILVSPDTSASAAMDAVRAGAFDYLAYPIDPIELDQCLIRLLGENDSLAGGKQSKPAGKYDYIIGESASIREVFRLVDKVAHTGSTVMIYGESGTGKELLARAIHENSPRVNNPLVPVNCGAIPEELLESELFGHEKGAFTSAIRTRIGRFEMADGGTIFLDEIADMSPKLQVKILRVLQEHKFERIGGGKTIDVDIRVITATNKDLRQAMEHGHFREDLFYRLNVIPITVPPLRKRRTDIPILVDHFLKRFMKTKGSIIKGIKPEALDKLLDYSWPGNIRELENILERMVILAEGDVLTVEDLPLRIREAVPSPSPLAIEISEEGIDFNQVVSDFENQLLIQALKKSNWVKNKAAQLLKLNRTTLVEKLKKKEIHPPSS